MGFVKSFQEESDMNDFLQLLIDDGLLENPALGITKKVISEGINSLSDKQEYCFRKQVLDLYTYECCSICSGEIFWHEMYQAYDNGGSCSYCNYMLNKDD